MGAQVLLTCAEKQVALQSFYANINSVRGLMYF